MGSLGYTMADDRVCVPALMLLFGQNYPLEDGGEPSHQRYDNITTAAAAAEDINEAHCYSGMPPGSFRVGEVCAIVQ